MKSYPNSIIFSEVEEILKQGKEVSIRLIGNSMYPFLLNGKHIIYLRPITSEPLKKYNIALFKYRNTHILHRLIRIDNSNYIFRGDANKTTEIVQREDIIAIVSHIQRDSGRLTKRDNFVWKLAIITWNILYPFRRYTVAFCRYILRIS